MYRGASTNAIVNISDGNINNLKQTGISAPGEWNLSVQNVIFHNTIFDADDTYYYIDASFPSNIPVIVGNMLGRKDGSSGNYAKMLVYTNASPAIVSDNVFYALQSPGKFTDAITYVHDNSGHTLKNSGSSTGTGTEQTIAHGLSAIPTGCKAWIKYLVGTRYHTEAIDFDSTNVYPTVPTGIAYEWRIE
jgi:hypothetical protein